MKNILFLITFLLFMSVSLYAQTPEKLPYQTIIKTVDNELVSNSDITLKIILRQGSPSGSISYEENHSITTDELGLVSIEIGTGTAIQGDFNTIAWSQGVNFIETQVDVNGGTDFISVSVNQLLSVPYALHAKTADFISNYTPTQYKATPIPFTSTRNVATTDIYNTIVCTTSATLTFPSNFSAMEVGDYINLEAHNGATLTIVAGNGVTLNYATSGVAEFISEAGNVKFGLLRKSDVNSYIVSGQ